jgi:hypothetical protein
MGIGAVALKATPHSPGGMAPRGGFSPPADSDSGHFPATFSRYRFVQWRRTPGLA